MKPEYFPNILSLFRMLLVVPAVWTLMRDQYLSSMIIIAIAVFTDGLDGFLAKHFHWRTRVGGILDPLADKLLFVSVFVAMTITGLVPFWLFLVVILRDALIIGGGLTYHRFVGPFIMAPTLISKLNTLALFLFTMLVLLRGGFDVPTARVVSWAGWLLAATSLTSGLHYVWIWGRRALVAQRTGVR